MRTHVVRGSCRIALGFVVALAVTTMLGACASETKTTETPGQPPPASPLPPSPPATPPAAATPAPGPGVVPPTKAPPSPPATPGAVPPAKAPPAAGPVKPVLPEGTTYYVHTVKYSGETASIIAAWYLGDKMRFDVLSAANPEINPRLIKAGMKIKIPENAMKTREPMPKDFVDSFYRRPPKASPSGAEEEEPQLIGPKESPPK
jgi:hypothetical protein